MSFQKILDKHRKLAFSEHDKGDRFERLMQAYLKTDPKYAHRLKNVWLWNEFPGKLDLGGSDTGIDLVALTNDGDYWAIQCKCYQATSAIDKPAVDSFLSTSSREFKNEESKTTQFKLRIWISTTNKWGGNAEEAIRNQNPPVIRINLFDLTEAPVDWEKLDEGVHGEAARTEKKTLRPHQQEALEKTHEHFKTADRGKLIMACGTGKTFNSLRIAEHETDGRGLVLFLVPSIALLGQSLREWSADANEPINAICICSDPEISKKKTKNEDTDSFSVVDLALPASTDPQNILEQFQDIKKNGKGGMTVVFSTYQSIEVISKAQKVWLKNDFPAFDLIICDEAHRTTGVKISGRDESAFTKVHDAEFIQAKKRLYMTATPRMYEEGAKTKAAKADALLWSMDQEDQFGKEIYRIGFGKAVEDGLLTDYKVLILTLNDQDVPEAYRKVLTDEKLEINTDDASKIIGTINALSKQFLGDDGTTKETNPDPMRRAVAFSPNIKRSKQIMSTYNVATDTYLSSLPADKKEEMVSVSSKHMDGTMAAPARDQMLSWLKEDTDDNECRVITNVKVLSEGVDVPSLDAVLFLSARNSQVDVVQSVGRVMRRSEGKKYGYIIIPVVVPSDVEPEVALDDNERYKVVWTVLNALRAHDDRFNATVNKIALNRKKPANVNVVGTRFSFDEDGMPIDKIADAAAEKTNHELNRQLAIQFEQLQSVVYARMVKKVGDRRYWEDWAAEVAQIAERQIERIHFLIANRTEQKAAFAGFLAGLQKNINPSISVDQAVEMLAQHMITRPIFEALFEGYSFTDTNTVSVSMQSMLDALQEETLVEESERLQKFYDSVRRNISDLDNAEAKQKIIIRIYDNFFKTAFPKMVEQLGIVYTPTEVVDFIIHSVEDVLQKEFGRSISDENVHVLDPFTGTGTFMTRLIQSGLIATKDLARKYRSELHANEIVLLAYYIAAVNIENAFHDELTKALYDQGEGEIKYEPFEGIVLTDTFQLDEKSTTQYETSKVFTRNSERIIKQKQAPLRVIIGNPPYSVGQKSANDNAQNLEYEKLDGRIASTYAKATQATNKNSLYDSYIKAFRWSTDRLDPEHGGVIAFVSNGAWIDGNSADGFRKVIEKEFSSIWVFNLRGNQRTSGELSRKEGGKIFGSGSRTPISITILVKNPSVNAEKATIHYHDIGDYLSQKEKLDIIRQFKTVANSDMKWKKLNPNADGDWISQRNELFDTFIQIGDKKKKEINTFFAPFYSNGVKTNRDPWVYSFNKGLLEQRINSMMDFYNSQVDGYNDAIKLQSELKVEDFITTDKKKISWSRALRDDIRKSKKYTPVKDAVRISIYRPFVRQHLYFAKEVVNDLALVPRQFPSKRTRNAVICISTNYKDGSVLITDAIPDLHLNGDVQAFPLYYYEKREQNNPGLFDEAGEEEYIRRDGISDFILQRARKQYGKTVSKEDIFYYVYGILHSPDYRQVFANDLKKMLPRLPLLDDVRDFWAFSKAGRQLADLHIHYEEVPTTGTSATVLIGTMSQEDVNREMAGKGQEGVNYRVEKMRFPKKGERETILYNSQITITNIPERAYDYVVNGKSAIEWIMERYQVTTHKESGITNDPNDWAKEVSKPRYILDLLLSVIHLSLQTLDIVEALPRLDFETSEDPPDIHDYDLVTAKVDIGSVPAKTIGTVVHTHEQGVAYEVEFIIDEESFVETVQVSQIKKQ